MSRASRKPSVLDWLSAFVLAACFGVTWWLYDSLPDPMPSHFGLSGLADGWMPRLIAAWLLPTATAALGVLFRLGPWVLPRQWRPGLRKAPLPALILVFVTMLCGLQLLILRASLSTEARLDGAIWVLGGAAMIAIGVLMPRTGRNALFGVRTKWTMASEDNWKRAQRIGGHTFVGFGAAMAILGALGFPGLALAALLLMGVVPLVWSWTAARRRA